MILVTCVIFSISFFVCANVVLLCCLLKDDLEIMRKEASALRVDLARSEAQNQFLQETTARSSTCVFLCCCARFQMCWFRARTCLQIRAYLLIFRRDSDLPPVDSSVPLSCSKQLSFLFSDDQPLFVLLCLPLVDESYEQYQQDSEILRTQTSECKSILNRTQVRVCVCVCVRACIYM